MISSGDNANKIEAPNHNVSSKVKANREWCLNAGKWIYSQFASDKTLYGRSKLAIMTENRNFGAGTESIDRYKKLLSKKDEKSEIEKKVYSNVNWERMSVLPKYRNIVINKYMAVNHKIDISAIDEDASIERAMKKWSEVVDAELEAAIPEAKIAQGLPLSNIRPKTSEEIEIIEKLGGYKLQGEIVHKKMSIANFYNSDWSEVKRMMIGDAFDNNMMACKDYTCPETGMSKARYLDILRAGCSHNKAKGHNNSEFYYEFVDYKLSELRIQPQLKNLTEKDWEQLADANNSYRDNASYMNMDPVYDDGGNVKRYGYDNCDIPVMEFEIVTTDKDYYTFRKKDNTEKVYNEKYGKEYDTPQRTTKVDAYKNIYKGCMTLNQEHIFDYGQQYDIPRPLESECKPSFHFYSIAGPSIVELAKGDVEDVRMSQIRLQNLLATADNPGIAIEWSSLQNIKLGGSDVTEYDILRLKKSTGTLVYSLDKNTGAFGHRNLGGSGLPFKELAGGMGKFADELWNSIGRGLENIRNLTGINEIADGSSPNPETTARQAMLAQNSSNNAIGSIYAAYVWIKKETAENLALRTQLAIVSSEKAYKSYYPIADGSGMDYIEMTADQTLRQLGIRVIMDPTEEQIAEFLTTARESVAAGHIDMVEMSIMTEYAREGRTQEALVLLDYRKRQKDKAAAEQQNAAIKQQGEQQAQLQQMKTQDAMEADKRALAKERELSAIRLAEKKQLLIYELEKEKELESHKARLAPAKTTQNTM